MFLGLISLALSGIIIDLKTILLCNRINFSAENNISKGELYVYKYDCI